MLKPRFITTVAVFLLSANLFAAEVKDSEQHFLANRPDKPNCLWRIRVDLDADQRPEELLTLATDRNGRAGNIWQVYRGTGDGFVAINDLVSFRDDAVFFGHIQEIKEPGLLTYLPGGAGHGTLIAFQLRQGKLIEKQIGEIHPQGENAAIYQRYFGSPTVGVMKQPVFGGKCP